MIYKLINNNTKDKNNNINNVKENKINELYNLSL
jgi:hypothetical protein